MEHLSIIKESIEALTVSSCKRIIERGFKKMKEHLLLREWFKIIKAFIHNVLMFVTHFSNQFSVSSICVNLASRHSIAWLLPFHLTVEARSPDNSRRLHTFFFFWGQPLASTSLLTELKLSPYALNCCQLMHILLEKKGSLCILSHIVFLISMDSLFSSSAVLMFLNLLACSTSWLR